MRTRQAGFTLVEIAIVLVIIGLLLGGVLKGQELINSAKAKNFVTDFRTTSTIVYAYQDRFRALPGDDPNPVAHVGATAGTASTPAAPAARANGLIEGAWNSATATDESFLFWQHVRMANLATGTTSIADIPAYVPVNSETGRIGISSTSPVTTMTGSFFVCSARINGRFARQIDSTMDDGNTTTGSVRAITDQTAPQAAAVAAVNVTPADDATPYTVCASF